jgi:hypothetical protein
MPGGTVAAGTCLTENPSFLNAFWMRANLSAMDLVGGIIALLFHWMRF